MRDLKSEIKKFLEANGIRLVDHLKKDIQKKKKVATGNTLRSVKQNIEEDGTQLTLTIEAAEDIAYILGGRKKGKRIPPAEELEAWVKAKGLKLKGKTTKQTARSIGFAVARGVSKEGIRGTNLRSWAKKEDQKIFEDVQELIEEISQQNFTEEIVNDIKASGIPVQVI
ncbi:MAG: hypothetical protein ACTHMM_21205 [Agriterribacter sp.]